MTRRDPPRERRAPAEPAPPLGARSTDPWLIAGLVLMGLALRLHGIGTGLPEVYEEAYPFKTAWRMWGWGPGRGLDLNPHWFWYPGLTIYLQFMGQGLLFLGLKLSGAIHSTIDFRILHELDKTPFYLTGRSITAVLGAATVIPVFLLARRIAGRGAAIGAGILVALHPGLIAKSQVIEVDVPLTFLVAASLLTAVRLVDGITWRRVLAAGVLVGLAAGTKYPGLVLLVPNAIAILLAPRAPGRALAADRRARAPERVPGKVHAIAGLAAATLLTVFVTSPFLFLDYGGARADLADQREYMRLGHFGSDLGPAWVSYLREWFTRVAAWPVALTSLAALVLFMGARRRAWALVVGSYVACYAGILSLFALKADRYLLPLLPAAFVFAVSLASEACNRVTRRAGDRRLLPALAMGTALGILALPALVSLPGLLAPRKPDTRTLAKAWCEAHIPAGSWVAIEQYGPPLLGPLVLQAIDRDLLPALHARGYSPRLYAVISVPVFQVAPERSAKFYDPALHRVADAYIVTGSAQDRYRHEPERFATQLAFYDTLATTWERWQEFPSNGGAGPRITVYRNPAQAQPFAQRRPHPGLPPTLAPGPTTGGEAYFYYNLGINYELFGFLGASLRAYLSGANLAAADPDLALGCVERAVAVLVRAGRAAEALGVIDGVASLFTRPRDAERLRVMRERSAGPPR